LYSIKKSGDVQVLVTARDTGWRVVFKVA